MISFKAMEEIETCVDDLIDDCKDNINYMKNSIKIIKRKLSKLDDDNDKISLENDLSEHNKSIELYSKIMDSLYQSNPGHDAIIAICFHIVDFKEDGSNYGYGEKLLSDLESNNRHGISELYFRDELYLLSLVSILDNFISYNLFRGDAIDINYSNYTIDKVVGIIKKNHGIDEVVINKAKYVVDIYNKIDTIIQYCKSVIKLLYLQGDER